jgi:mycothiol synthase
MEMAELRAFCWEDLEATVDLLQACEAEDQEGSVPTVESLRHQMSFPGYDATKLVYVLPEERGGLSAFCVGLPLPGPAGMTYMVNMSIHPDRRPELEDELLLFMEGRAVAWCRKEGATATLQSGYISHQTHRRNLLERHGYEAQRWFLELERDLTLPIPEMPDPAIVHIRPVRPETDAAALHTAMTESFLDHWNPMTLTAEQLMHFMQRPAFRPKLNLLAVGADGEPAGLCLCTVREDYNRQHNALEGLVDILGVRRPFRREGVGRTLLLRGLEALRAAGMTMTTIVVDADSPTGANRLYASVGFTERKRSAAMRKPVDAETGGDV